MKTFLRKSRNFAIVFVIANLFFSSAAFGQEPTVTLDQADLDYAPGETVYITGAGWQPGETVTLEVSNLTNPDVDCGLVNPEPHVLWTTVADQSGNFSASWYVNDCELGAELFLEAFGTQSGFTFEIFFTDAISLTPFTITSQTGALTAGTAGSATYTIGIKVTGSNPAIPIVLTIPSLPSGVSYTPSSVNYNNGTYTFTLTLSTTTVTSSGSYPFTVTASSPNATSTSANGTLVIGVQNILDYANLQFPATATICQEGNFTAFGQVYEPGITEVGGVGAGITAELGYSASNTNPSTWTTWTPAAFNAQVGNNDEYMTTFGSALSPGTYYYTFRYSLNGAPFQYGGYPNGFWNGSTQVSGVLTVNVNHTISLNSGSDTQTICQNIAISNISYLIGGGVTGANVSGLPSGVTGNFSAGIFTISGTPTASGIFDYTVTTSGNNCTSQTVKGTITVKSLIDYANLQYPGTETICQGGSFTAFGQVYEPGITPGIGSQGAGIVAEFGYSTTNTDPSTWVNWATANFNAAGGGSENDEYQYSFTPPAIGTYYYTFRYTLNGCQYQYGGYTNTGGGFWGGSNVSGVVKVNALPTVICPTNQTITACTSQADINTAFLLWLSTASATNGVLSNNNTGAPDICGGSKTVIFTSTSTTGCGFVTCSAIFMVTPVPALVTTAPTEVNLGSCTDAAAIQTAYNTWVAGFTTSAGCSPTSNIASIPTLPSTFACDGADLSFTLTANNADGKCVATSSSSSTFKVGAAPALVTAAPTAVDLGSCTDAAAIQSAYNTWVAGFTVSAGCSPTSNIADIPALPSTFACDGADLSFTLTANNADGKCVATSSSSSTFKVVDAPALVTTAPTEVDLGSCTDTAAIQTAYNTWVAGFTVSAGCSPTSNIADIPALPLTFACDGSDLSFTLTANNADGKCVATSSSSSTFKVVAAPALVTAAPTEVDLPACTDTAAIQTAYNTWVAGFTVSAGCSPTSNIADIPALPSTFACDGADLSFTLTANNADGKCVATSSSSSTFKVGAAPALVTAAPTAVDLGSCTDAAAIQSAYNNWVAGFTVSAGCSPTSNIADIPALPLTFACDGADLSFTLTANNANGKCVATSSSSSTFKVGAAPVLVTAAPTAVDLPACTDAAAIQTAYNTWVAGFTVSAGCSSTSNIASIPALPSTFACDGVDLSFTLTANNADGKCVATSSSSSTFKVGAAPALVTAAPTAVDLGSCTDAAAIQTAYNTWVAGFTVSAGCSPTSNIASIPALPATFACDGVDLSFTLTANNADGKCVATSSSSSTFKVGAAPALVIAAPTAVDLPACTDAAAIQTAYNTWVAGFTVSAGCSPTSNIASIPALPATFACDGADLSFTLTANNADGKCVATSSSSSTFKVGAAPALVTTAPTEVDLGSCTDAAAIQSAYNNWVAGFTVSAGCSPTSNIASIPALPSTFACDGADLSFTLTANNADGKCVATSSSSSTFKVGAAPALVTASPTAVDLASCTDASAIQTAYDNWVAGFTVSAGCSPTSNITSIPALPATFACDGADLSFTLTANNAEGKCVTTSSSSSTFKVGTAPTVVLTAPLNKTEACCQSQATINASYTAWLDSITYSGGCNLNVPNNSNGAPSACGGSVTVTWTAKSSCQVDVVKSATFAVTATTLSATITTNNPTLYYGYSGDQKATITANPSGGTGPYTIKITMMNGASTTTFSRVNGQLICSYLGGNELWTPGANTASSTGITCATASPYASSTSNPINGSYSVDVTLMADARFVATVTDANGCSYTIPYDMAAKVDAEDARCFAGNSGNAKVTVCHRTGSTKNPCVTICVDQSAVQEHLNHGDYVGKCTNDCKAPVTNAKQIEVVEEEIPFKVTAYPNPSSSQFTLLVEGDKNEKVEVLVYDMLARLVKRIEKTDGQPILFGEELPSGEYLTIVKQGENMKAVNLIKQ